MSTEALNAAVAERIALRILAWGNEAFNGSWITSSICVNSKHAYLSSLGPIQEAFLHGLGHKAGVTRLGLNQPTAAWFMYKGCALPME
jgi:hypothetical protein